MIRLPNNVFARLTGYAALLALAVPLAAQQQDGFSLPQPTPSPTPAPAGPADERAGVAIPPRAAPAPQPESAPALAPKAAPSPAAAASTQTAAPTRTPARTPAPTPAPTTLANPAPAPRPDPADTPTAAGPTEPSGPGEPLLPSSAPPLPLPEPTAPIPAAPTATDELALPATPALPDWWPFAAGGLGALALLGGSFIAWRRRRPKVLRLAAPPPGTGHDAPRASPASTSIDSSPNTLDVTLDITAATRSVMMFTLQYRIALANRSAHAVNGVSLAVALTCARHGANNAPSPGAAQRLEQVDRIGPHQTRIIAGEVQLPLSQIAPLRQGKLVLFIPLAHVTIEGDSQHAIARSFVIGTPSGAGTGRLHPIRLDLPPGSIPDLQAQRIDVPAVSAAA